MLKTGCNCHKCHGNCHKPRDKMLEKRIEFLLNARDVRRAIYEIGEPITEWGKEYFSSGNARVIDKTSLGSEEKRKKKGLKY